MVRIISKNGKVLPANRHGKVRRLFTKEKFNCKWFVAFLIAASFYIPVSSVMAHAADIRWSDISTTYQLSKQIPNNRVFASFTVFAAGDNYTMALRRVTMINNRFLGFLKKLFNPENIKTQNGYNHSKTASIIISISSSRIGNVPKILQYIAEQRFAYKTGVKPNSIRFAISEKRKQSIQMALFRSAIIQAKQKLKIVGSLLGGNYIIRKLNIRYQLDRIHHSSAYRTLMAVKQPVKVSAGSNVIKSFVTLTMSKKIDK